MSVFLCVKHAVDDFKIRLKFLYLNLLKCQASLVRDWGVCWKTDVPRVRFISCCLSQVAGRDREEHSCLGRTGGWIWTLKISWSEYWPQNLLKMKGTLHFAKCCSPLLLSCVAKIQIGFHTIAFVRIINYQIKWIHSVYVCCGKLELIHGRQAFHHCKINLRHS